MTTLTLARPRTRRLVSWRRRKLLIGYSYLVPAAICLLATVVVPIILAIKMSLYADVLYKPQDFRFIGLGNYLRLIEDPVFWLTLKNSVVWVFGSVILQFIFGFAAALLLQQAFRGRALVRTLTLLPWVIPGVVVGLIWEWLYQPNYGVINDLLISAGWMHDRVAWLSNPDLAMGAVVFTNVWRGIPFFAIALALENNLDIAIARYNLNIADTDVLRARAGSAILGVPLGTVQNTPGGGVGGLGGQVGSGTGGTSVGAAGAGADNVHSEAYAEDGCVGLLRCKGDASAARQVGRHGGDSDAYHEQSRAAGKSGRAERPSRAIAARHYRASERQRPGRAHFDGADLR